MIKMSRDKNIDEVSEVAEGENPSFLLGINFARDRIDAIISELDGIRNHMALAGQIEKVKAITSAISILASSRNTPEVAKKSIDCNMLLRLKEEIAEANLHCVKIVGLQLSEGVLNIALGDGIEARITQARLSSELFDIYWKMVDQEESTHYSFNITRSALMSKLLSKHAESNIS